MKAWAHLLLPNLQLKCDSNLRIVCSIKSMTEQLIAGQATDEIQMDDEDHVPSVTTPIDVGMLTAIPNTIRDVLQRKAQMQGSYLSCYLMCHLNT